MSDIAVFGAGGRAGRAITAEARRRGHRVTAVVRDPARHPDLAAEDVRVVAGDVRDPDAVTALLPGHRAAVNAVSPASGPEELARLGQLDERYFVAAVDALLAGAAVTGVPRLVVIGLFANLVDERGRLVLDDPDVFPPALRPFALAHTAGLERLRAARTPVDWLVVTPPAGLTPDGPRTGRYRVGGDRVAGPGSEVLSYADLAVAVVDEIEAPRHHRTRISVHG